MLLDWLALPAQVNERQAIVDRAFGKVSAYPATILQRTHWVNAIRVGRATYFRIELDVAPDLAIAEVKAVSGDPTSITVRVVNVGQWATSQKTELMWSPLQADGDLNIELAQELPVPPLMPGKEVSLTIKSGRKLHGLVHAGYYLVVYPGPVNDGRTENNTRRVEPSVGTKQAPSGPPQIKRGLGPQAARP